MFDHTPQLIHPHLLSAPFPVIPNMTRPSVSYCTSESRTSGGGRYIQESHTTTTLNGVTTAVWKRIDQDGNEHITRTYPDGRELYTVNGVEQFSSPPRIEGRYSTPRGYQDSRHGYLPSSQPPLLSQPPPGTRPEYSRSRDYPARGPSHHRHRDLHNPDTGPVYPDDHYRPSETSSKRKWWRGGL